MNRTGSTRSWGCALLLLLLPGLPACSACPPEAAARTAHPDYASPASTGLSFFAALGCDDARAEYGALGESLKQRHGATFDAWILARPALREELGWAVRYAHKLQPGAAEVLDSGVLIWWSAAGAERIGLLFQAQHFLELVLDDGREVGFHLNKPPGDWMQMQGKELLLFLEVEDPVLRGVDPARVQRVTLATEWKIADWTMPATDA